MIGRVAPVALLLLLAGEQASAQAQLAWESLFPNTNGLAFAVNPLSDSVLYGATNGRFYVTYDAGTSWQQRGSIPPFEVRQIAVSPGDTSVILLYANGSIFRSSDAGFTWSERLSGVTMDGETIEFHPLWPDTVFYVDFVTGDLYRSTDAGLTWTRFSDVSAQTVCSLSINRYNPLLMIAGAGNTRINRSTDGGLSWQTVREANAYFSEIPKLKWDPTDSLRAFAATYLDRQYSVFRTTDGSASWQEPGIFGTHMWALDIEPVQGRVFVGSFGDPAREGIFATYDAGGSWQRLGTTTNPYCWMIKATSDSVVHALSLSQAFGLGSIYRIKIPPLAYAKGTIRDSVSGLPVQFASILVEETGDRVSVGNDSGTFTVALLPGTYTLRVQVGSVERTVSGLTVSRDSVTTVDILFGLDIRQIVVQGRVSNIEGEPVESLLELHYTRPGVVQGTLLDTTEADGSFSFEGLTTLLALDQLVARPLELPYLTLRLDTVLTDRQNLLTLSRADVLRVRGPGDAPNSERYRIALEGLGTTSLELDSNNPQLSSALVGLTGKGTVIWYARHDSTGIDTAVLDSLRAICNAGYHLIMTGQNMLEFNGWHGLFAENLGVGFSGNYSIAGFNAPVSGVPGNPVGDGLAFQFLKAAQTSPDRLSVLSGEATRAFAYGTDASDSSLTAGVTVLNTGSGGRALVMGMDLGINSGALVAEVLSRCFVFFEAATDVQMARSDVPAEFTLYQNYPNPFNPATTIAFSLPAAEVVWLRVYSILGQEVAELIAGERLGPGTHRLTWDGILDDGRPAASGVYLFRVSAGARSESRRMLLVR